jgi:hypothetical protein
VHDKGKVYLVPVGLSKQRVTLCSVGYSKLLKNKAKLQYKKAEGIKAHGGRLYDDLVIKRSPYIFARYCDSATGKEVRPELGRWLLASKLPVTHLNGKPLDFRLKNLVAQETGKQVIRHAKATVKRIAREELAAKRKAEGALKPLPKPDGLTPDEQIAVMSDKEFRDKLTRKALKIIGDKPCAEEVVSMAMFLKGSKAREF